MNTRSSTRSLSFFSHFFSLIHHQVDQIKRSLLSIANSILENNYFGVLFAPDHLISVNKAIVSQKLVQILMEWITPHHEDPHFVKDFSHKYALQIRVHQVIKIAKQVKLYLYSISRRYHRRDEAQVDHVMLALSHLVGPFKPPTVNQPMPAVNNNKTEKVRN